MNKILYILIGLVIALIMMIALIEAKRKKRLAKGLNVGKNVSLWKVNVVVFLIIIALDMGVSFIIASVMALGSAFYYKGPNYILYVQPVFLLIFIVILIIEKIKILDRRNPG